MNPLLEQEYLNKINECKENAKKYYDSGDYEKASEEYLSCSNYCESEKGEKKKQDSNNISGILSCERKRRVCLLGMPSAAWKK